MPGPTRAVMRDGGPGEPGAVSRKIALTRQIEEMKVLVSENATALATKVRRREINQGLCDTRLERQRAILKTLEFNQAHEAGFRDFMAQRAAHPKEKKND